MGWPFGTMNPFSYDFIMADPAWTFKTYSEKGLKKSAQNHYECMSLDDIQNLPVGDLAAGDCLLWLWATNPMLPEALDTLGCWGFKFCTSGVWHKRSSTWTLGCDDPKSTFGGGYVLRSASEPFLIGKIGNPKTANNVRGVVEAAVREHSRKPDEAYLAAEKLCPNARRADLFSREKRTGWDGWGFEAKKFNK